MKIGVLLSTCFLALGVACSAANSEAEFQQQTLRGGFPVEKHNIPLSEIMEGGPAKDAIPALTNPKFVSAEEAERFLDSDDRVLAIEVDG